MSFSVGGAGGGMLQLQAQSAATVASPDVQDLLNQILAATLSTGGNPFIIAHNIVDQFLFPPPTSSVYRPLLFGALAILSFSALCVLTTLVIRFASGPVWIIRRNSTQAGEYLVPHTSIAYEIPALAFHAAAIHYTVRLIRLASHEDDLHNVILSRGLIWIPLWLSAWMEAWGTWCMIASRTDFKSKAKLQRLLLSPAAITFSGLGIPLLIIAAVCPLFIISNIHLNRVLVQLNDIGSIFLSMAGSWNGTLPGTSTLEPLIVMANVAFAELDECVLYFRIGFYVWAGAGIVMIMYHLIAALIHNRRLQADIRSVSVLLALSNAKSAEDLPGKHPSSTKTKSEEAESIEMTSSSPTNRAAKRRADRRSQAHSEVNTLRGASRSMILSAVAICVTGSLYTALAFFPAFDAKRLLEDNRLLEFETLTSMYIYVAVGTAVNVLDLYRAIFSRLRSRHHFGRSNPTPIHKSFGPSPSKPTQPGLTTSGGADNREPQLSPLAGLPLSPFPGPSPSATSLTSKEPSFTIDFDPTESTERFRIPLTPPNFRDDHPLQHQASDRFQAGPTDMYGDVAPSTADPYRRGPTPDFMLRSTEGGEEDWDYVGRGGGRRLSQAAVGIAV